jgi:hypothetical protein
MGRTKSRNQYNLNSNDIEFAVFVWFISLKVIGVATIDMW